MAAWSRDLRIAQTNLAVRCPIDRVCSRTAARQAWHLQQFPYCEHAQQKIVVTALGSKPPCGSAAACPQRNCLRTKVVNDWCQPKADMGVKHLGRKAANLYRCETRNQRFDCGPSQCVKIKRPNAWLLLRKGASASCPFSRFNHLSLDIG